MVNGLHLYSAFIQSALQWPLIHPFTHQWRQLPCKVLACSLGAIWGSVSCPRTLRHVDRRSRESNRRPFDHWTTRSTNWATAAPACSTVVCYTEILEYCIERYWLIEVLATYWRHVQWEYLYNKLLHATETVDRPMSLTAQEQLALKAHFSSSWLYIDKNSKASRFPTCLIFEGSKKVCWNLLPASLIVKPWLRTWSHFFSSSSSSTYSSSSASLATSLLEHPFLCKLELTCGPSCCSKSTWLQFAQLTSEFSNFNGCVF